MKVLVACVPKSGSTFLTTLICRLDDFSVVRWSPAGGHREQELAEEMIRKSGPMTHQVAQHHVRASEYTMELIQTYNILPIVLVRDIFDCAVSLADHTGLESNIYSMAFIEDRVRGEPFQDRLSAIIDLALPWYLNFYASWFFSVDDLY